MGMFDSIGDALGGLSDIAGGMLQAVDGFTDLAKSLMSLTPQGLVMELAQNVLSEMLEQLPPELKELGELFASVATGDFQGMFENSVQLAQAFSDAGASPFEVSNLQNGIQDLASQFANQFANEAKESKGSSKGESWMMILAKAMAEKINDLKDDAVALQEAMTKDDPGTSAEFNAKSQELNIMMTTAQNVLKTLGDGLATLGRK